MVEVERNKAVVLASLEAADRGDHDAVAACYAPDYQDHGDGGSRATVDKAGALAAFRELAPAFRDLRHEVLELIGEGDRVVLRVRATAIHSADVRGIRASGRALSMTQTVIYRLHEGLIVERWADGAESVLERLRKGQTD